MGLEDEFHFSVTLAVYGDKGVGKSSLIKAMLRHRLKSTILRYEVSGPVAYTRSSFNHDGVMFLLDIVECPGEKIYRESLAKFIGCGASFSLFVYDVSEPATLEGCSQWIEALTPADTGLVVGTFFKI